MQQKNKKKGTKMAIITLLIALCGLTIGLVLEKLNITHFYTKKTTTTHTPADQALRPENSVDYTVSTETPAITDNKTEAETPPPSNAALSVSITRAAKSSDSKSFLVKAVVEGTNSGSCTATLTQGNSQKSINGTIGLSANQVSCLGLTLPLSSLSSGQWRLVLSVTDDSGATAFSEQEVSL